MTFYSPYLHRLFFIATCFFLPHLAFADNACFIAMENKKIIKEQGACDKQHPPFSTFKVPLAVMAFDANILRGPDQPLVGAASKEQVGKSSGLQSEKLPALLLQAKKQTPRTWMKYAVMGYSQVITKKLGEKRLQYYIDLFNYGNKEVSQDTKGRSHLTNAWLGEVLLISPKEQLQFIDKLRSRALPVSQSAQKKTIQMMKLSPLFEEWQLYGKTGGPIESGWFIGWVEKNGRVISFVQFIEQPNKSLLDGGRVAREIAIENLASLIVGLTFDREG